LKVDPQVLSNACGELGAVSDELLGGLRRLESTVEGTLAATWKGQAASAFGRHWHEFRDDARKVVEASYAIAELVQENASRYSVQEHANASAVGSVGRQL
jgi:WXG100 family type VII secretion target